MKNVTITLDETTLSRARVEAARDGKSLSRFVSELVEKRVGRRRSQADALEAFLAGPLLPLSDETGKIPSRAELYDDALLPGYEHPALQPRPERPRKAREGG